MIEFSADLPVRMLLGYEGRKDLLTPYIPRQPPILLYLGFPEVSYPFLAIAGPVYKATDLFSLCEKVTKL